MWLVIFVETTSIYYLDVKIFLFGLLICNAYLKSDLTCLMVSGEEGIHAPPLVLEEHKVQIVEMFY